MKKCNLAGSLAVLYLALGTYEIEYHKSILRVNYFLHIIRTDP